MYQDAPKQTSEVLNIDKIPCYKGADIEQYPVALPQGPERNAKEGVPSKLIAKYI